MQSLVNCYLCFPKCCSLLTGKAGPANLWQNNCCNVFLPSFLPPSLLAMSYSLQLWFTLDSFDNELWFNLPENSGFSQTNRTECSPVLGTLLWALLGATLRQETWASTADCAESFYGIFCLFSISLQLSSSLSFTPEAYFQEGWLHTDSLLLLGDCLCYYICKLSFHLIFLWKSPLGQQRNKPRTSDWDGLC